MGQGGFGKTYLGFQKAPDWPKVNEAQVCLEAQVCSYPCPNPNTEVIIKEFIGGTGETEQKMFKDEATKLRQLGEHPQIPSCLGYYEQGGKLFLVQELVVGADWVEG